MEKVSQMKDPLRRAMSKTNKVVRLTSDLSGSDKRGYMLARDTLDLYRKLQDMQEGPKPDIVITIVLLESQIK